MNVRKLDHRILAHVMPQAAYCCLLTGLAWVGSMIEARGNVLHVIPCGRENFYDFYRGWNDDTRQVHIHSPGDWSRQATEGDLIWVLYSETYRHRHRAKGYTKFSSDVQPVTKKILEIWEDIVEELRVPTELETSLDEISFNDGSLVDRLQENDTFKELQDNFHPFSSREAPDLANFRKINIVLAKVIIAVSSI